MKNKILTSILLIGSAGSGWTSQDQELSLYGIHLLKPLTLKECQHSTLSEATRRSNFGQYKYIAPTRGSEPCFRLNTSDLTPLLSPPDGHAVTVEWPLLEGPAMVKDMIGVLHLEGVVHRVRFVTHGLQSQSTDFEALRTKFGEPAVFVKQPVQNMSGAKFEVINALWKFENSSLAFKGATSSIDRGEVVLQTKKGEDHVRAIMDKALGKKPSL